MSDIRSANPLSVVLINLMKGVIYRDSNPLLWQSLVDMQVRTRDHVTVLGLELMLDETEGCAYLRQRPPAGDQADLPRLVARRPLGYQTSLLLVLLRKKLVEFDAGGGEKRLILSKDGIVDMIRVFLQDTGNEARMVDRVDGLIKQVVEMGFIRRLDGEGENFEVRRILKSFIDAQWLSSLLESYRAHSAAAAAGSER